ncbi:hypothetical protein [Allorhodopirellula heiligendammensis]|uniref:Uncharacterized protein n=1 Tax=Allorhodopirellula heiligendammensis TaxID=2714739 RepID=A0A5C6BYL7_9BACT|nr:hypothetical protein [Allorhodopirellula heiligendammensis]TWU16777.1 hypothetical protein Poly21_39840 [Allorhodopirellula heiligendammensis]
MSPYFSFQAYVYRGQGRPLGRTLEQAAEAMNSLPGLFFEWDGSLTWANQTAGWQIDATIFDDGQQIQYIDLHGRAVSQEGCRRLNERIGDLFAAWGDPDELNLMRLPDRRWQNLHDFAKESQGDD